MVQIKPRDRDTILQALRAGVVPRIGLQHIQVGRALEIQAMVRDIEMIENGGSSIRFVIGEYGSGKTFFLNLTRLIALEKGLVTMSADLAPDRRLHASGGQARGLYAEMTRNMATRTKPDGGALSSVVERFISKAMKDAEERQVSVESIIRQKLAYFEEYTGGFEFAEVIQSYWLAYENGDDEKKSAALRWLRGEFATRTDARKALGVRTIVDDASVYDQLKLMSAFVVEAGYTGLLIALDEMVNLFKLSSSQARNANYEQILRILNDVLQGSATHIGFVFGGTPEFLLNTRRGLYSYEALQSRLAQNRFARDGLVDMSGPVINLSSLTPEDLFVLLSNIRRVMFQDDVEKIPDQAIEAFMNHCNQRIGEAYFRTPRESVTAFINFLSIIEQNPGTNWSDLVENIEIPNDAGEDLSDIFVDEDDDELANFKI